MFLIKFYLILVAILKLNTAEKGEQFFWLILVMFYLSNYWSTAYQPDATRDALLKDILKNYNPSVRPGQTNETVMLFVNIEIQHFDFREKDGAFHLVGQLHVVKCFDSIFNYFLNSKYIFLITT